MGRGKEFSLKRPPNTVSRVKPVPCLNGRVHHWVCGEPIDNVIKAVCKNCKKKREYPGATVVPEYFGSPLPVEPVRAPFVLEDPL